MLDRGGRGRGPETFSGFSQEGLRFFKPRFFGPVNQTPPNRAFFLLGLQANSFIATHEAIHSSFRGKMDCFAEPVSGRRFRATSLARKDVRESVFLPLERRLRR